MPRHAAARARYLTIRHASVFAHEPEASLQFDALIRELSELSVAPTRRRLRPGCDRLETSELRGYVRARAVNAIRSLVRILVAEGRLSPLVADETAARALERTVHLIVRDIMKRPVVSEPMQIALQRAA